ncbi:MAG: lipid IV(A) palmitoyltransferase PagP [Alphaproteobacteria bacterium]
MLKKFVCVIYALFMFFVSATNAEAKICRYELEDFWNKIENNLKQTWNGGTYDLYVPVWTWHNRLFYDKDKIEKYNEEPWGIGLGVSRYDEDGDWHGLYAMGFKDSNFYLETIFGYAYLKNWELDNDGDWKGGIGFTASLTQRHEYSYIPVPLPLPIAGLSYKGMAVQAAYVPGVKNDGNVLFTWLRFELN